MIAEPGVAAGIAAVTVDLDDTLFPQSAWLAGAWLDVATAGETLGLDRDALLDRLHVLGATRSGGVRIIDRALLAVGVSEVELPAITPGLAAAFQAHAPSDLHCYPGVDVALVALRSVLPVGCITDGDPHVQRAKLRALGLIDSFDAVVFSDETGRQFGKPHPAPFERALHMLGVDASEAVHVGDRPAEDVAGASAVGMRAIRVHTGEYAGLADDARRRPWQSFDDAAMALNALTQLARA
jgi:HAD superfamily hydrolase (TIGR01549 family)